MHNFALTITLRSVFEAFAIRSFESSNSIIYAIYKAILNIYKALKHVKWNMTEPNKLYQKWNEYRITSQQ